MCWSADEKTKQFAEFLLGELEDVQVRSWCTGITSGVTIYFVQSGHRYFFKVTQPQQGLEDTMSGSLSLERHQSRAEVQAGWRGAPPQHVFLSQLGLRGRDQFQQRVINLLREREVGCA